MKTSLVTVNHELLDHVLTSVMAVRDIQGCQCIWVCTADDINLRTWMHHNPTLYTVQEMLVHDVTPSYKPHDAIENFVLLNVSLRHCTYDVLMRIAQANPNLISIRPDTSGLHHSLQNLDIHHLPHNRHYVVVARLVDTLSTIEKEWLSLWRDFNWDYQDSDDVDVWMACEDLIYRFTLRGKSMGLSPARMLELRKPQYRA